MWRRMRRRKRTKVVEVRGDGKQKDVEGGRERREQIWLKGRITKRRNTVGEEEKKSKYIWRERRSKRTNKPEWRGEGRELILFIGEEEENTKYGERERTGKTDMVEERGDGIS